MVTLEGVRIFSSQRLAVLVVLAFAALPACPVNPSIDPANKSCTPGDPNDLCPTGFDCVNLACVPACTASQQKCDPMGYLSTDVLSAPACHCESDCACGQICVADPYWTGLGVPTVCEDTCDGGTTYNCNDPATMCNGTSCVVNTCPAALSLYQYCKGAVINDSTCLPLGNDGGGVCVQGNPMNANGVCTPGATRGNVGLCPPAYDCEPAASSGVCYQVCVPGGGLGQCAGDAGCLPGADGVPVCTP